MFIANNTWEKLWECFEYFRCEIYFVILREFESVFADIVS